MQNHCFSNRTSCSKSVGIHGKLSQRVCQPRASQVEDDVVRGIHVVKREEHLERNVNRLRGSSNHGILKFLEECALARQPATRCKDSRARQCDAKRRPGSSRSKVHEPKTEGPCRARGLRVNEERPSITVLGMRWGSALGY